MKIKITLTAHGHDSVFKTSSHAGAEVIISAFMHGIGRHRDMNYSRSIMASHKWQKYDGFAVNASWFAEIVE